MTEISHFTIVCSRKDKQYLFQAKFKDEFGNIQIIGIPDEISESGICAEDRCEEDVFFTSREVHLASNRTYLSFRVVGYDFRGYKKQ